VKADQETRQRLLRAATQLFGERGLQHVTVREICRAARANVAAVNYHFGDKLELYREVLRSAIDVIRATTEAARQAGEGRTPEEQLRAYIRIFLQVLLAPDGQSVHRLITREVGDTTPALDLIVEHGVRPRVEYLSGIVARILGCDTADQRVLRCVASIQSQSIAYLPNPIAARLGFKFQPTPARIEEAAEHIAVFSIAGIRALGRARAASVRRRSRRRTG